MRKIFILSCLCSLLWSCDNFEDDINVNPNLPTEASGMQLIANAQISLSDLSASTRGNFLAQYLAETQYVGTSLYPEGGVSFYGWYQGPLMNLEEVINAQDLEGSEGPVVNQKAIAKILKAYLFWNLTDRWGDIPFSEALQGADNFTPSYDTQEAIYDNIFALLKQAESEIVVGDVSGDIVYNGDMDKWRKFSSTLRMLMALRLSEVNPERGNQEFNDALNSGIMTSNDDNLVYSHLAEANHQSYWYDQVVETNREWWAVTTHVVDAMLPFEDPRLEIYADPARNTVTADYDGDYVGMVYGSSDLSTEAYSNIGPAIYAQDLDIHLVTYAQALFAIAEASERGWVAQEAEEHYNLAIENSILQWTGTTENVEAFLAQPDVAYDPANWLESISNQRWVHLYMHGYEAWAEWRRTGYPEERTLPAGKNIPLRLQYPDNEYFNNTESYQEALQRQFGGEDDMYQEVWWDQ